MRRFIITSHAFKGQAELIFKEDNTLCKIDVTDTDMPAKIIQAFKSMAPVYVDQIEAAFAATKATVVEADFEVSFDMFWKKYNKKINKFRCIKLWEKMEITMKVNAYFGIDAYTKHLKYNEAWRTKADPETYLRNQYWENEYGR
jgi:hypothetical protein